MVYIYTCAESGSSTFFVYLYLYFLNYYGSIVTFLTFIRYSFSLVLFVGYKASETIKSNNYDLKTKTFPVFLGGVIIYPVSLGGQALRDVKFPRRYSTPLETYGVYGFVGLVTLILDYFVTL